MRHPNPATGQIDTRPTVIFALARLLCAFGWGVSVMAAPMSYQAIFGSQASVTASSVDSAGNIYLAGSTASPTLPVTPHAFQRTFIQAQCGTDTFPGFFPPLPPQPIPCTHAFVAKIDPSGKTLIYLTYLGGELGDGATLITADGTGNVYVEGTTTSLSFPTTPFAYRSKPGNAFLAKLSADGSALLFSTYLDFKTGGATAIALDKTGNVYLGGWTGGDPFDTTPGAFQTKNFAGNEDGFILKLNQYGTVLLYSTLLGGTLGDVVMSIAVDDGGNVYAGGYTASTPANARYAGPGPFNAFPVTPGAFTTASKAADIFITKLNASGSALIYSSVFGGTGDDALQNIAIDAAGNAYFTGYTFYSPDFPTTTGAFQKRFGVGFVGKLTADGSQLVYSTYLGGGNGDIPAR
jgi:hypothetical protein